MSATFEENLKALEAVVETLEKGQLPLEKALEEYEKGLKLSQCCQKTLEQAEQKISQMTIPPSSSDTT